VMVDLARERSAGKVWGSESLHGESRAMIEILKSDEIVDKLGGRFKMTTLIQRRWLELMQGARPLIEREGRNDLELAIAEVLADKITIDFEQLDITPPNVALK
jgi:DNA-directed RNA polymerase subunit omega